MFPADRKLVARVSAMDTMATALAHELNQPLTAVANFMMAAKALLETGDEGATEEAREALRDGIQEAIRAGQIVHRLHDFVVRGETDHQIVALSDLIDESITLAQSSVGHRDVLFEVEIDGALSGVLVDRVQIQQVLLNLIRNSVEAMQGWPLRRLSISARPIGEEEVEVGVTDTGGGIPQDIVDRLFQPFVSTKSHGLGVGLSISRNIVEAHGGRLWWEPNPEGGAIFRFTITRIAVPANER